MYLAGLYLCDWSINSKKLTFAQIPRASFRLCVIFIQIHISTITQHPRSKNKYFINQVVNWHESTWQLFKKWSSHLCHFSNKIANNCCQNPKMWTKRIQFYTMYYLKLYMFGFWKTTLLWALEILNKTFKMISVRCCTVWFSLKDTCIPVEPRPCSTLGQLTRWENHAGSHKDGHHQNCNPPTGDLQSTKKMQMIRWTRETDTRKWNDGKTATLWLKCWTLVGALPRWTSMLHTTWKRHQVKSVQWLRDFPQ